MSLLGVAWLAAAAFALTPGEVLELDLAGDVLVSGTFRSSDGQRLVLTVQGQPLEIDLDLVEAASRNGLALDSEALRTEAIAWAEAQIPQGPSPHPALVGTASALWPGSGHLILREPRTWAGYALVDASLLALAGWYGFREQSPKAALMLLVLDGVFRVYSVREAVLDARRRDPAFRSARIDRTRRCQGAVSLYPLAGGNVVAAAGYRCGGPSPLEETSVIH